MSSCKRKEAVSGLLQWQRHFRPTDKWVLRDYNIHYHWKNIYGLVLVAYIVQEFKWLCLLTLGYCWEKKGLDKIYFLPPGQLNLRFHII